MKLMILITALLMGCDRHESKQPTKLDPETDVITNDGRIEVYRINNTICYVYRGAGTAMTCR